MNTELDHPPALNPNDLTAAILLCLVGLFLICIGIEFNAWEMVR